METFNKLPEQTAKDGTFSENPDPAKIVKVTKTDVVDIKADVVDTKTDAVETKADVVETKADVVDTKADVVETKADVVETKADVVDTKTDVVETKADVVETKADVVETKADVVETKTDVVETKTDVVETKGGAAEMRAEPAGIRDIPNDNENIELGYSFSNTGEINVPPLLIDQILGQEDAVEIVRKAARQRRHVMMIGTPGTGKSLLAKAMAELLPREELEDILVYPNAEDSNNPRIRRVPAGKGREIVAAHRAEAQKKAQSKTMIMLLLMVGIVIYGVFTNQLLMSVFICLLFMMLARQFIGRDEALIPKLLVSNYNKQQAPYIDATAAHAGALLGDVRHDPFQSGGLETPAHDRVEAGAIHKSHKGVLFIDEINILGVESQQSLLTALQEKEYGITGQSERSSGALVKTEPVPCDFIMVAAGNVDALEKMHPALRSRIKGYGYEVYMRESMPDTPENRDKYIRFVAQEVMRDGHIPQFDENAVKEIIREAKRRSGRKGQLTLKLRDLGGLVRVAGDLARADSAPYTTADHVLRAKRISRSIEQQLADRYLENKKDYESFMKDGGEIGRVNGLAVIGGDSGVVLPILSEVTSSISGAQGNIIATGQLRTIAREAVKNVSAVIKKVTGKDIEAIDIHIQFVGTYEGVEGDSASISIATAVLSAYEKIPVNQTIAMTGSLSVRGDVLPVGGVTYKIEAAAQAGIKKVIIPKANESDVMIEDAYKDIIEIIPVSNITEVVEYALVDSPKKDIFLKKLEAALTSAESSR